MEESAFSTTPAKKKRIAFIDLTRAYAILMMVQGHTVEMLTADRFRNPENFFYRIWELNRGLTAPLFLFMAGCIFTYLLIKAQKDDGNRRAVKGARRSGFLFIFAYILQFNPGIFAGFPGNIDYGTYGFVVAVHILHCIAVGLVVLIGLYYASRKLRIDSLWLLGSAAAAVLLLNPLFLSIDWSAGPRVLVNFFTHDFGSLFPIVPWHFYLLVGACLGNILTKFPDLHLKKRFALGMILFGILAALVLSNIPSTPPDPSGLANARLRSSILSVLTKLFCVFAITGAFAGICIYVRKIPSPLLIIGRNTLLIYTIHIFVVYRTFWSTSLFYSHRYSLAFGNAILCGLAAIAMVLAVLFALRYVSGKLNLRFFRIR